MSLLRKFGYWFAALLVLLTLLLGWLLATESGARFVVGQLQSRLPAGASIDNVHGSFMDQLLLSRVSWRSEALDLDVHEVAVSLDLIALLGLKLHIESLNAGALDILQKSSDKPDSQESSSDMAFSFSSPVALSIDTATVHKISLRSAEESRLIDTVEFAASLQNSDLVIKRLLVRSSWLSLDADATLTLKEPYEARLDADWGLRTSDAEFSGLLSLNGDFESYQLEHRLKLPVAIETSGQLSLRPGLYASLLNQWTEISTTYQENSIQLGAGRLSLEGDLQAFDIALQSSATINDREIDKLEFSVQGRGDEIALKTFTAELKELEINASGHVYLSDDSPYRTSLALSLNASQLESWYPGLDGAIALTTGIDASFDGARLLTLTAAIDSLQGNFQEHVFAGSGALEYSNDTWQMRDFKLQAGDNKLSAAGSLSGQDITSQATITANDLSQAWPGVSGRVNGELTLQGSLEKPILQTSLKLREVRAFDLAIESMDLEASLSAEQEIQLRLSALSARVKQQDIDSLVLNLNGSLQAHRWDAALKHEAVSIDASASGQYQDPSYNLSLETLDVLPQGLSAWSLAKAGEIRIDPTGFSANDLCLRGSATEQVCVETLSRSSETWGLQATAEFLPIRPLLAFVPVEIDGSGTISAQVSLQASDGDPEGRLKFD